MAPMLLPHQARYTVLAPGGGSAGSEALTMVSLGGGTRVTSSLSTAFPASLRVEIDWELDAQLVTQRLLIQSRSGFGEHCELELSVTGNGLLAHRVAPEGPTQVELGWGPNAELDYLSAAFAAVMGARTELAPGGSRLVDTVYIAPEDLVPEIVSRELTLLADGHAGRVFSNRARETGHQVRLEFDPSGALRSYQGLLRLDWLSLEPAPTK